MGKIANVIGASGLVGQQLVVQLLENPEFERLFVVYSSENSKSVFSIWPETKSSAR
jgi:aspartate-semialdehyde dehydrogenase